MPESKHRKEKPRRLRAGEEPGVGASRYRLIRSAAQRISDAIDAGYWLEAVTLVESILTERLEKRAQYLHKHSGDAAPKKLVNVKDGFANLGPLISALKENEADQELREMLDRVDDWREARNIAVHQMAKFGTGAQALWNDRLKTARQTAEDGVGVLLDYDKAETRVSHEARKKLHSSATCPDALGPLGQETCTYCESLLGVAGRRTDRAGTTHRRRAAAGAGSRR